jgi:hypothetical protein
VSLRRLQRLKPNPSEEKLCLPLMEILAIYIKLNP